MKTGSRLYRFWPMIALAVIGLNASACDKEPMGPTNTNTSNNTNTLTVNTGTFTVTPATVITLPCPGAPGSTIHLNAFNASGVVIWRSTNTSVVDVTNGDVTAKGAGTAMVYAKDSKTEVGTTFVVSCSGTPTTGQTLGTITVQPPTASQQIGTTLGLTAICRDTTGATMPCPTLSWLALAPNIISVSQNGVITFVGVGNGQVCAQSGNVQGCGSYTGTSPATNTLTITPNGAGLALTCGNNGTGSVSQQFTVRLNGVDVPASSVTWTATGGTINTSGVFTSTTGGSYSVTGVYQGQTVTTQGNINNPCTVTPTIVITPQNPTITLSNNGGVCTATVQFSATNAQGQPIVVSWSAPATSIGSINSAGLFTGTSAGTVTITASAPGMTSATTQVTVNGSCAQPSGTISINPPTFSTVVGAQVAFNAIVETTGGMSSAVVWSVSDATCMSLSVSGTTAVGTALKPCSNVQVTVKLAADLSKSATSTGNIVALVCTFTSDVGMQADGSITLARNQSAHLTGSCNDGSIPFWFSNNPELVSVVGSDTTRQIGTKTYYLGSHATITAIGPGTTTVYMQTSISDTAIRFSRVVRVP